MAGTARFIQTLIPQFISDPRNKLENAWDINTGFCEEFALRLEEEFPEGRTVWYDELYINDKRFQPEGFESWEPERQEDWFQERHDVPSHCVFQYQDRYYDSQDIHGVEDWTEMQVFRRVSRGEFLKETQKPNVSKKPRKTAA